MKRKVNKLNDCLFHHVAVQVSENMFITDIMLFPKQSYRGLILNPEKHCVTTARD